MSRLMERLSQRKPTATFTTRKLDLMNAVTFDQRVDPYSHRVFHAILFYLNAKNGKCFPSDDLIVEMIGGSRMAVYRSRCLLRQCGYLDWRLTGRRNHYIFNFAAAAPALAAARRLMFERKGKQRMLRREEEEERAIVLSGGAFRRDRIKTADLARGHWPMILAELGIPRKTLNGRHQPRLFCGGKDRARFTNHEDAGLYYCNQCGVRDGFQLPPALMRSWLKTNSLHHKHFRGWCITHVTSRCITGVTLTLFK